MEDNEILDLYFARDQQAITETDRKYGNYCYGIANRILCSCEDAEETVSDTYFHTWNAIPPQRPDVFKLFLAKITRNLAFCHWQRSARSPHLLPIIKATHWVAFLRMILYSVVFFIKQARIL